MNLVDTIKGYISPGLVDKAGSMLGIAPDQARSAADAVIPGLLAGIAAKGSTPDGARTLSGLLDQTDDSILDDPAGAVASRGGSLMESGGRLLQSFLGGNAVSGLGDTLGRFTGLGGGSITSLLGMVAPFIFGGLRRAKRSMNLDDAGLAGFLQDQKRNISAAMPSGLAGMLAGVPGLGAIADTARGIGAGPPTAAREAVSAQAHRPNGYAERPAARYSQRMPEQRRSLSPWAWALPLIAVLALGWLVLSWLNRPQQPRQAAPASGTRPAQTVPAGQRPDQPPAQARGLSEQLTSIVDSAEQTLAGVGDQASALNATTRLQDLNAQLDSLRASYANVPESERRTIGTSVSDALPRLRNAADRAMENPSVQEVLGPAVDSLMQKLRAFTGG